MTAAFTEGLRQKSMPAKTNRYALTPSTDLSPFLDDGRFEIDSIVVERAIRLLALNHKNTLFTGSDGGASTGR